MSNLVTAIGGIFIRDNRLLIVRKKNTWILPGGKPEGDESDIVCLALEFREELGGKIDPDSVRPYKNFGGVSPHRGKPLEVRTYFVNILGETDSLRAQSEILQVALVKYLDMVDYINSDLTWSMVGSLHDDHYLRSDLSLVRRDPYA